MDSRFIQANKEARWSVLLTLGWLLVWSVSAWQGGNTPGVFGFPRWFELSCLFAPLLFLLLCALMIRFLFRDISLEDGDEH
ncbi:MULTISPECIES: DUF997 family protein [unclassified Tatumella]|uniref:DUF997 family protein n=1 Tax=unclassified Tatumella TaxID=2649542 RepID=UPI001BAEDC74|nr:MULTISPECIES: DUF997 family protein [unclassified Tatumella]MBS0857394.1 DUF997 family protein [Tatumella sp. JGM16]MBS0912626.1 DUF997 family protein [Tatumella sp. JGM91]